MVPKSGILWRNLDVYCGFYAKKFWVMVGVTGITVILFPILPNNSP
jgi:hypothetical protein